MIVFWVWLSMDRCAPDDSWRNYSSTVESLHLPQTLKPESSIESAVFKGSGMSAGGGADLRDRLLEVGANVAVDFHADSNFFYFWFFPGSHSFISGLYKVIVRGLGRKGQAHLHTRT